MTDMDGPQNPYTRVGRMDAAAAEQTRNACNSCRSRKVRCLPSEVEGICEKCYRSDTSCVYAPPRVRVRRQKLVNRIEQLEQTLVSVTAQLTGQLPAKSSSSIQTQGETEPHFQSPANIGSSLAASPDPIMLQYGEVGLTSGHIQSLLKEFEKMCEYFPYVIVPDLPISRLKGERPLLLLAVLASASWSDRALQIVLDKYYLRELADQMIVNCQQSLDMLQSLLVYVSWCHFHLKSGYQLLNVAVGLVTSLGLDIRPENISAKQNSLAIEYDWTHHSSSQPSILATEARRAYVGCYVVSTSYAIAARKGCSLKYSKLLEECALSLAAENEAPQDRNLIHFVHQMRLFTEINDIFCLSKGDEAQVLSDEKLKIHLQYFDAERVSLKARIPPEQQSSNRHLYLIDMLLHAFICEVGLHNISGSFISPLTMSVLVDCVFSVKQILDELMNSTQNAFRYMPGYHWSKVHYLIKLTMELTFGVASSSWSIHPVRNILELETYIDFFCHKLDLEASTVRGSNERNWFEMISANWNALKLSYLARLQEKRNEGIHQDIPVPECEPESSIRPEPVLPQDQNMVYNNQETSSIDLILNNTMGYV